MVVPKEIRKRVEDLTQDEAADLFATARIISSTLQKCLNCPSSMIAIQDGPEAGRTVEVKCLLNVYFHKITEI